MALPSGYVELEYIQSTGNQYINTAVNPTQSTKIELVVSGWSNADSNTSIFGVSPNTGGRYEVGTTGTGGYRSYYNGSSRSFGTSADAESKTTILRDGRTTSIGDVAVTHTAVTFTCDLPLFLFARNNLGTATGYATAVIYSCKIYDNGTLIRDYIPCKNDSGEVGLYDLVNSKFYGNAGTGAFVDGPSVAPQEPHYTLIGGTSREIENGTGLIGGVVRDIENGLTLVNGVSREIPFTTLVQVVISGVPYDPYSEKAGVAIDGSAVDNDGTYEFNEMPTIAVYVFGANTSLSASCKVTLNGQTVQSGSGIYNLNVDAKKIKITLANGGTTSMYWYTADIVTE